MTLCMAPNYVLPGDGHTRSGGPRSRSASTYPGRANVRQVRGALNSWRASLRPHMPKPLRASTPTTATYFAAPCMTPRHAAWAVSPAAPGCSRRCRYRSVCPGASRSPGRSAEQVSVDAIDRGADDDSPAARTQRRTTRGGEQRHPGGLQKTPNTTDPLLAPNYPALAGQDLRGFGWDSDTAHSRPRGMIFPQFGSMV